MAAGNGPVHGADRGEGPPVPRDRRLVPRSPHGSERVAVATPADVCRPNGLEDNRADLADLSTSPVGPARRDGERPQAQEHGELRIGQVTAHPLFQAPSQRRFEVSLCEVVAC